MAQDKNDLWSEVDNIKISTSFTETQTNRSSTVNAIQNKLRAKYGTEYIEKLLKYDATSYTGYAFSVYENNIHGITQCNADTLLTADGNLITYYCTTVVSRYTTVNGDP